MDYGGLLQLWDTARGELVNTYQEHTKRAWTVDCSTFNPRRMLSAGDDGTVRLWSVSESASVGAIGCGVPIYCAQFSPTNANHLAVGCANYSTYLYDLRRASTPLLAIPGHRKAISYVRFIGGSRIVTASIDSTVKLWDVAEPQKPARLRCTYKDHLNEKIFVGLDARDDGYILCGSETNQVYCYVSGLPVPVLKHTFASPAGAAPGRRPAASSVCWSSTSNLFLAGNTAGSVDLLEMTAV